MRFCSPPRSVHRGNEMNDELYEKDVLTSAVLQGELINMPLSVM